MCLQHYSEMILPSSKTDGKAASRLSIVPPFVSILKVYTWKFYSGLEKDHNLAHRSLSLLCLVQEQHWHKNLGMLAEVCAGFLLLDHWKGCSPAQQKGRSLPMFSVSQGKSGAGLLLSAWMAFSVWSRGSLQQPWATFSSLRHLGRVVGSWRPALLQRHWSRGSWPRLGLTCSPRLLGGWGEPKGRQRQPGLWVPSGLGQSSQGSKPSLKSRRNIVLLKKSMAVTVSYLAACGLQASQPLVQCVPQAHGNN